jgi:hypothetical protein
LRLKPEISEAVQDAKAASALVFWKHEAKRLKAKARELDADLMREREARRHDTRIFYRSALAFADASRSALSQAGAPPFEQSLRLAHGGTLGEFSEWWVKVGEYVERGEGSVSV